MELDDHDDRSYFGDSDLSDGDYTASKNAAEHHVPVVKSSGKFSDETLAVLKSLYKNGMVGWGRSHADEVKEAVAVTGLQPDQVKVYILVIMCIIFIYYRQNWIRRENMRKRHGAEIASYQPVKKKTCSSWHCYLKEFSQTEGDTM